MSTVKFIEADRALSGGFLRPGWLRWLWFGWRPRGSAGYQFVGHTGLRLGGVFLDRGPGHAIRLRDHAPIRTSR
ncbi:MAG: hypothetical protein WCL16_03885 [bacterium]